MEAFELLTYKGAREIFEALKTYPARQFSISELSRLANLPFWTTWRMVQKFERTQVVEICLVGKTKAVRFLDIPFSLMLDQILKTIKSQQALSLSELKMVIFVALLAFTLAISASPAPVDLGAAGNFLILAESAISDTPISAINGNVGLNAGASISGLTCSEVNGTIYDGDSGYIGACRVTNATLLATAVNDMETAYNDSFNRTPGNTSATVSIDGMVFAPGVYSWTGAVTTSAGANVTINGSSSDVWIFQITDYLSTGANSNLILINGAQAKNIFWQVTNYATLGANSVFNGNILSKTYITLGNNATLYGRALAQTAVTLDADVVSLPNDGNLSVNATAGGSATGNNSSFIPPANLTINATADTGYYFINWTTGCNGSIANATNPNTQIQVNDTTACYAQANFAQYIPVPSPATGGGSSSLPTSLSSSFDCASGSLNITATAYGSHLSGVRISLTQASTAMNRLFATTDSNGIAHFTITTSSSYSAEVSGNYYGSLQSTEFDLCSRQLSVQNVKPLEQNITPPVQNATPPVTQPVNQTKSGANRQNGNGGGAPNEAYNAIRSQTGQNGPGIGNNNVMDNGIRQLQPAVTEAAKPENATPITSFVLIGGSIIIPILAVGVYLFVMRKTKK